jgi:hypothetical protein
MATGVDSLGQFQFGDMVQIGKAGSILCNVSLCVVQMFRSPSSHFKCLPFKEKCQKL